MKTMLNPTSLAEELRREFSDDGKPWKYSLQTSDDKLIWIGKELWSLSPVLKHYEEVYKVNSPEATVKLFIRMYHRNLERQHELTDTEQIAILSLVHQLQLEYVFPEKGPYGMVALYQLLQDTIPPECSPDDVLNAFEAFCQLPLREKEVYRRVLSQLKNYSTDCDRVCDNASDFMNRALDIATKKLGTWTNMGLGMLPTSVDATSVPVSIIRINGIKTTAAFHEETWVPVDLFGRNLDVNRLNIRNFYLKYGRYVLFKNSLTSVYIKSLNDTENPTFLLDDCLQLLVRKDDVFVLTLKNSRGNGRSILKWDGSKFNMIMTSSSFGQRIDYCRGGKLLACLSPSLESIFLYRYQNGKFAFITSIDEDLQITSFCLFSIQKAKRDPVHRFVITRDLDDSDKPEMSTLFYWCGSLMRQVNTSTFCKSKHFRNILTEGNPPEKDNYGTYNMYLNESESFDLDEDLPGYEELVGDLDSEEELPYEGPLPEKKQETFLGQVVERNTNDARCISGTVFGYRDDRWYIQTEARLHQIAAPRQLYAISELKLLPKNDE